MKLTRFLRVISIIIIVALSSCNKEVAYEIVDSKKSSNGGITYTVFTPDTNWNKMQEFAESLLEGENHSSAVGFFNPKDKVPILINGEYISLPEGSINYLIANYSFNNEMNSFVLEKSTNIYSNKEFVIK